jgi:ribonuclease P protein component
MLRRFRLRRSADFESLRRNGQRWHHPLAILVVNPNGRPGSRFGFSASRYIGKATVRNRVKRLLREAVRKRIETIQPGWDCLFIARSPAAEADYHEIEEAVAQLLWRADVLIHERD